MLTLLGFNQAIVAPSSMAVEVGNDVVQLAYQHTNLARRSAVSVLVSAVTHLLSAHLHRIDVLADEHGDL
jgi:hypothetical protein